MALAFVLFAAGVLVPRPLLPSDPSLAPQAREILLLHNTIHTDIAIPVDEELRHHFRFLSSSELPIEDWAFGYLAFGWGGRSFYIETPTWSDLKPMPTLKALTLDSSVMHVGMYGDIDATDPAVTPVKLTEAGYRDLITFIDASFSRVNGEPQAIAGAGYSPYDAFFEANGSFNALLGCNTWTAATLRSAGLRTGFWNPLPRSLETSLRLYSRQAFEPDRVER